MSSDIDAKTRAVDMIRQIIADGADTVAMTDPDVAAVVGAVEVDLIAADQKQTDEHENTEQRLLKVEAQTRALSEAVVAIADPGDAIAPAIKAVKAEM